MAAHPTAADPLSRYVPRLLVEWLRDAPDARHRVIGGTGVFADLSGFTAMTERLAAQGTAGAEETGEIINDIFETLLSAAYDFGATLVKWGGDAVLLLFHGEDHPVRATRAAWVMQNAIDRVGRVDTSAGRMRIRMSVGVHTGDFHLMLVGRQFRELVVTGPAASATARMERVANAGQVMLSQSTAALLEPHATQAQDDDGFLLIEPPDAPLLPRHSALETPMDLGGFFDPVLRDHLVASRGDFEHRSVVSAFVAFNGTDRLLVDQGPDSCYDAVAEIVTRVQDAAALHGVVVLATDVAEDGGKVLLASGAPNKLGDDATRMLRTLTTILDSPSRLEVRAGATQGRVFVGDFGAPFRGTYSLVGDSVNLAARLTYRAAPGELVATPEVVQSSDGSFLTRALEAFKAKGKAEPVQAVAVTSRGGAAVAAAQLPLIGRREELAALVAAAEDAAAGRGTAIDIVGDAGIGKSRLLTEYEAVVGAPLLRVDGDLYAQNQPYLSAHHLLRDALEVPRDAASDEVADALADAVATSAPRLAPWLPLLAIAAGTTVPSTPEVDALDSTARSPRLRRVTSDLLGALLDRPVTLILNDIYAMDDASVALIQQLCADVYARPWSILITRRPDTEAAFPNATPMPLAALTGEDADALVVAASSIRIPAPRRAELAAHSGGNPLFLRALAETVAAGQELEVLPSEIEDILTAHMDRLTPDERAWLRTAAVLGTRVDPDLLAEITDEPLDPTASTALAEYIRPEADGTLVFAHQLIQRTAYDALPFRRRRTLHGRASYAIERRAGDAIEQAADVLAIHCLRGERFDAAWQYARIAGRSARERYALTEAAASLDTALVAASSIRGLPAREIASVAEDLAETRFTLGQHDQTERALVVARRNAGHDRHQLARLHLLSARHRLAEGRGSAALRWISRGRALLDPADHDDLRLLAELAERAAVVHHTAGAMGPFRRWAETAADEAMRCGDTQRAASALGPLAVARAQAGEPWEDLMADLSGSEDWDLGIRGRVANSLAMAAYYAGDLDLAETHYATAAEFFRRTGHEAAAATVTANRAEILVDLGRFGEAITALGPAVEEMRTAMLVVFLPFALWLLARAVYETEGAAAALPIFTEAHQLAGEAGDTDVLAESAAWLDRLAAETT